MPEKKYVIRHKNMPSTTLDGRYANTTGGWYYCEMSIDYTGGTWRHKSELKYLIVGSLDKINERYNRITTSIYKEGVLEIVELTDQLSEELMFAKLAG